MDELVERLRKHARIVEIPCLSLEAADRIEKLEAENARLRERRLKARRRARAKARFAARATLSDNRGVTK